MGNTSVELKTRTKIIAAGRKRLSLAQVVWIMWTTSKWLLTPPETNKQYDMFLCGRAQQCSSATNPPMRT